MAVDKWQRLIAESHFLERPFLHLYRIIQQYPWWVYGIFFAYCVYVFVDSRQNLQGAGESTAVFIFYVGVGPLFFFFSVKFMLWMLLRMRGFRAQDLRIE